MNKKKPDPREEADKAHAALSVVPLRKDDERPRRFKPVRFKDVVLNTDVFFAIEGLIPREGLTVVWGPPKCGKSFWVLRPDDASSDWMGISRALCRTRNSRYVACEGEHGLAARTEAYRQHCVSNEADPDFFLLTTGLNQVSSCSSN